MPSIYQIRRFGIFLTFVIAGSVTTNTAVPDATSTSEFSIDHLTTSEPENSPEPEVSSEPFQTPEPEGTSEPKANSYSSTYEPILTSVPDVNVESETTTEPEVNVESEVTSNPETVPETVDTSVSNGFYVAESNQETTTETNGAFMTEISVGTSEPEETTASEPESEATSEPEANNLSEPESVPEVSSEPEGITVSEPESEATSEPEANNVSEPESEPEVSSEPEGITVSKPESEATSEPEVIGASEPDSEPEVTSQPEGDTVSEPESEATSEPEGNNGVSEPSSEPEVTSDPEGNTALEPESEVTSEPEANNVSEPESELEVSSEPEGITLSEPELEATSEPEVIGVSEPESEPEVTSEPEGNTRSEPEVTSEPEENIVSEPEAVATSEPELEPESEPEVTVEPEIAEPESDPEAEAVGAETEQSAEPETRPSAVEIILPPFALLALVIVALLTLLASTHCNRWLSGCRNRRIMADNKVSHSQIKIISLDYASSDSGIEEDEFLTDFDREVLDSLLSSYNRPMELFRIALPAMLSLALCPLTLYMYVPFTEFIWPPDEYQVAPDINDAIACFLAPAGLVYATSFGFAFQQALSKQHHILTKVTGEISMVDQIATFAKRLTFKMPMIRREIYKAVKAEAIFMVLQILNREPNSYTHQPNEDVKVKIWSVVDLLRESDTGDNHHVDKVLCEKILSHIMKLNSICSDRIGVLHTKIHPVKWAFLETLGFFSFIGILLLRAYSYRMELVMCIITVFSISMLCYVVSDLDSPFSGFFRVDLSVLITVVEKLEHMYNEVKHEETTLGDGHSDSLSEFMGSPSPQRSVPHKTIIKQDAELWVSMRSKMINR